MVLGFIILCLMYKWESNVVMLQEQMSQNINQILLMQHIKKCILII